MDAMPLLSAQSVRTDHAESARCAAAQRRRRPRCRRREEKTKRGEGIVLAETMEDEGGVEENAW